MPYLPRLRIAMVSPIEWRTPPRQYGSRELITSSLTEGLVARGMDVTLFATADSQTSAKLRAICPRPLLEDEALAPEVWNLLHLSEVFERAGQFDIIHCHGDFLALPYSGLCKTPLVVSLHGLIPSRQLPIFHKYSARAHYVAINHSWRNAGLRYAATIVPGVTLDDYRVQPSHGSYFLFVGRIEPGRGLDEAVELARLAHFPLVIGGPVKDAGYFETRIKPLLDGKNFTYVGPIGREQRGEVYGRAFALVHLVSTPEPFRISMVEAMACGTPVIVLRQAAPPDLVRHRETGFLIDALSDVLEIMDQIPRLDRRKIRQHVASHFSRNRMVDDYLNLYRQILDQHPR